MIGIKNIGVYIPQYRLSNFTKKEKFNINDSFIKERIGMLSLAKKKENETIIDMCVSAYKNLIRKEKININNIDVVIVITQNPYLKFPHMSAILQGELGFKQNTICFDINLGCSGYTYGLSILEMLLKTNNLHSGLIFTADSYSDIIDYNDKNTSLLFGDAATVSLLTNNPKYVIKGSSFGTDGSQYKHIMFKDNFLEMNGKEVFKFTSKVIPKEIIKLLYDNSLSVDDIDLFILHQGSKYIVDTIASQLKISNKIVPFKAKDYGNTVSSSIPILLSVELDNPVHNRLLLSSFGIGLSWGTIILNKVKEQNEI